MEGSKLGIIFLQYFFVIFTLKRTSLFKMCQLLQFLVNGSIVKYTSARLLKY